MYKKEKRSSKKKKSLIAQFISLWPMTLDDPNQSRDVQEAASVERGQGRPPKPSYVASPDVRRGLWAPCTYLRLFIDALGQLKYQTA